MATQYTTILKLALPVQGELSGTWGDVVNDNITSMVEEAIAGRAVINTWVANAHTLTTANGTTSEARCAMLEFTDTGTALTGAGEVICPTQTKIYIAKNASGQIITVKTSAGTGVAVQDGETKFVFCDGTNVVEAVTSMTTLKVGTGVQVNTILDEDNMASDSATALATQQSIKAYVDAQVTAQDLDFAGDSGTGAVDLDSQSLTIAGTANEIETSASGQTLTVGLPAAIIVTTSVTTPTVQATNINANDGTASATIADSTGVMTINSAVLTTADINGGTVDNVAIGSATPSTGAFTTVTATGNITSQGQVITNTINEQTATSGVTVDGVLLKDGGVTLATGGAVNAILDEDNMASDSDTALATQQSIKAYVDAQVGANNELSEVLANGNTSGGTNIQMTTTDEVQFRDTALKISSSVDGQLDIDADVELEITAPTLDIDASTAVTIDTATFTVTGSANVVGDLDVDNLNLNGNSIISTNANGNIALTPNGTGEVDISKVDIDGGTIDGTVIGGSTPAAISGTTGTFSGDVSIADKIVHTGDTDTAIRFPVADKVAFETAGVERFNITSGGINLPTPASGNANISFDGSTFALVSNSSAAPMVLSTNSTERTQITSAGTLIHKLAATFNEDGADADFRVESDTNTHMLFVDAGNDRVGIGTASVSNTLTVLRTGGDTDVVLLKGNAGNSFVRFQDSDSSTDFSIGADDGGDDGAGFVIFDRNAVAYRTTITNAGDMVHRLGARFNESGSDVDFRVESDTDTHALFVDGGNSQVGIGTSSPNKLLTLNSATNDVEVLRINAPGAGGGTQAKADIGFGYYDTVAEANAAIGFEENGAASSGGVLLFKTRANGEADSTRPTERTRIDASGTLIHKLAATFNEDGADADFRVESDANTHMLFVDAGNGRVGIGTSSPLTNLHVSVAALSGYTSVANSGLLIERGNGPAALNIASPNTESGFIWFADQDSQSVGNIAYNHPSNFMSFQTNSSERMRIDSSGNVLCGSDGGGDIGSSTKRFKDLYLSGGVYLGGTGSANLLDDYETGTWTPSVGGTATYTSREGKYTKVGDVVFIYGQMTISTIGTGSQQFMSGLPFSSMQEYTISLNKLSGSSLNFYSAQLRTSGSQLYMSAQTDLDGSMTVNSNFMTTGTEVQFSGFYKIT